MKKFTIVMPSLNESSNEPRDTIESIYDTSNGELFDVIVIDDNSNKKVELNEFKDVKLIRNDKRMGVDWCRQKGGEIATTPFLLFLDSHMRFRNDDYLVKMIDSLERETETVFCNVTLGMGYGITELKKCQGKYYGADLKLVTAPEKGRPCRQIIEPKWCSYKNELEYQIQCPLGASYFMTREWFNYVRGFKGLKSWGSSEPWVALKTYLAGGSCKIRTDIEVAHFFRSNSPFSTAIADLVYNKLYILKTIFPRELEEKLVAYLPKDTNYQKAIKLTEENKGEICEEREYYSSIFKKDIYEVCNDLGIEI